MISLTIAVLLALNLLAGFFLSEIHLLRQLLFVVSIVLFLLVLQFFRHPQRKITRNEKQIIALQTAKQWSLKKPRKTNSLKDRRIQVSIFMSPVNVHVNRYPMSGKVVQPLPSRFIPGSLASEVVHRERTHHGRHRKRSQDAGTASSDRRRFGPTHRLLPAGWLDGKTRRRDGLHQVRFLRRPFPTYRSTRRSRCNWIRKRAAVKPSSRNLPDRSFDHITKYLLRSSRCSAARIDRLSVTYREGEAQRVV